MENHTKIAVTMKVSCRGMKPARLAAFVSSYVVPAMELRSPDCSKLVVRVRDIPYVRYLDDFCEKLKRLLSKKMDLKYIQLEVFYKYSSDSKEKYKKADL